MEDATLVERFAQERDNLHVPPNVGSGLPMDEDEIRSVYDNVISDLKAGGITPEESVG